MNMNVTKNIESPISMSKLSLPSVFIHKIIVVNSFKSCDYIATKTFKTAE